MRYSPATDSDNDVCVAYIDEQVESGGYGDTSEYIRDLIRRDRQDVAINRVRGLIAEGVASGEGRVVAGSTGRMAVFLDRYDINT